MVRVLKAGPASRLPVAAGRVTFPPMADRLESKTPTLLAKHATPPSGASTGTTGGLPPSAALAAIPLTEHWTSARAHRWWAAHLPPAQGCTSLPAPGLATPSRGP